MISDQSEGVTEILELCDITFTPQWYHIVTMVKRYMTMSFFTTGAMNDCCVQCKDWNLWGVISGGIWVMIDFKQRRLHIRSQTEQTRTGYSFLYHSRFGQRNNNISSLEEWQPVQTHSSSIHIATAVRVPILVSETMCLNNVFQSEGYSSRRPVNMYT